MTATQAALQLSDLSAGYGDGFAVRDATLDLPRGSVTAVIGPNGSGKSTLLKAILRLTPEVAGRVTLDGQPLDQQRARVAYVPQREAVDWSFPVSAQQVVLMGRSRLIGWLRRPRRSDLAAVDEALARVGMQEQAGRQIGALSGGQQQRVFLARALVQEASVYLLDEPMTGVDRITEELIVELFAELRSAGATVLYATHDLESAAESADYLCFVNRRIVAFGPPAETFTAPVLHETFGGELLILADDGHRHVHGGGHHEPEADG
ncbi:MAG TPA: metal ABC transporter ATP-binding protein [Candidatus Limnocylindria bacterium]|nr:metal ABC transporter ATP-binding protein [Candidatus Limnocylindria bacterium]